MEKEIEYVRFRERSIDKILLDSKTQTYKNRHEVRKFGYDGVLREWKLISTETELQDVSKYPTNPSYNKDLYVLIKRTGLDPNTLKQITKYFKQKMVVKSTDKNILLCTVGGRLFQTNFCQFGNPTQPICLNGLLVKRYHDECFDYLEVKSEEPTPITNIELQQLLAQGYPLTQETFLKEDGSESEYKSMV